jgi:GTP-binding protein
MPFDIRKCEFVKSAADASGFVSDGRPQIVFSGRSNVGKSSVINTLICRGNFARTGSRPGKTAQVNYFLVDGRAYFVDLPGYGYARAPAWQRELWRVLMESFFARPLAVALGVMIVDIRHRPSDDDVVMARWFTESERPFVIVANKSDKLKSAQIPERSDEIRSALDADGRVAVIPFSAEKGYNRLALVSEIVRRVG